MIILFNPPEGKPIGKGYNNFVYDGILIDPHLPGQLRQYPEDMANYLIEMFGYLTKVTPEIAKSILEKPVKKQFECEFCDFSSNIKIGLVGHNKKHVTEIAAKNEPTIDPDLIPVAGGEKITSNESVDLASVEEDKVKDGIDKDGVKWYGGGLVEEKNSMRPVTPFNRQGHFGGQPLTDE